MNEVFNKMVGQYILESRIDQKVSQLELAKQLGFSPQFMGRIEKGAVPIPENALKKAISLLGMEKKKFAKIIQYASTWYLEDLFQDIHYHKGSQAVRGRR